jgi:hypothetical protein
MITRGMRNDNSGQPGQPKLCGWDFNQAQIATQELAYQTSH